MVSLDGKIEDKQVARCVSIECWSHELQACFQLYSHMDVEICCVRKGWREREATEVLYLGAAKRQVCELWEGQMCRP